MKVVCIDTDLNRTSASNCQLEWGKVYESVFVMYEDETREPVEWDKNLLNLEEFSEFDWFPTKNFVTLDVWRQKILNQLGIK